MENVLLTNGDKVKAIMKEVGGLQQTLTDVDVRTCVTAFVDADLYDTKKSVKENVSECLTNMAFRKNCEERRRH